MHFSASTVAALALPAAVLAQNATQDACGKISDQIKAGATSVKATDAQACLHAIPFDQFVAQQFLTAFNDTNVGFQVNRAYIKNPPASYQQSAKDLYGAIENIQDKMNIGSYVNEYDYEADFMTLICQASHSGMEMGSNTLSQFTFTGPLKIASVSSDGQSLPEVYAFDDLNQTASGWTPSPMSTINGNDALVYYEKFATVYPLNQLELHGDWQSQMTNAAAEIGGYSNTWTESKLFQDIQFNVTFKNGSNYFANYSATVNNPSMWANVSSGQDFFDTFVTPTETHNEIASAAGAAATAVYFPTSTVGANLNAWPYPAYPKPMVVQQDLGNGGWMTGYMVNDATQGLMGVLSIPSFSMGGAGGEDTPNTVSNFISQCQSAGCKKIVFDLQGNPGGNENYAIEVFRHFFPNTTPFYGTRVRQQPQIQAIGSGFTSLWEKNGGYSNETEVMAIDANPWIPTQYLDAATGQYFTSFDDFINGYVANGDQFSKTQLSNFSDPTFDMHEVRFMIHGFGNTTTGANATTPPFAASDMMILTDSRCAGACSVFMELMVHQGQVKTVAAGGAPGTGPMQASGGFRGTQFSVSDLQNNVGFLSMNDPSIASTLPTFNYGLQSNNSQMKFTLRELVRQNETFPLSMAYEAADCRIFYTMNTVNNYTNLWSYAANALFSNNSMCVQDSTGQASATTNMVGPSNPGSGVNISSSTGGLAPHLKAKRAEPVSLMGRGITELLNSAKHN